MIWRFDPILRPMVWGSELWVLSGYPERLSVVTEGHCKGLTINQLVAREKESLLGGGPYRRFGDEFPLLVKFLDVHDSLSIQVHPSEEFAQQRQGLHGKTEMWYVIRADEGAQLMAGFSKEITPEEYARRVADGSITDVIARHDIEAGDVFFIPPGRVHALLKGSYIAEIQQTSDSTYRIWDYNRPGLDGKLRPLHTQLAMEALDYRVQNEYKTAYPHLKNTDTQVVSCPWFTTSVLDLDAPFSKDLSSLDSFLIVMCLEGGGAVRTASGETAIGADGCLLVSADESGIDFVPSEGGMKMLLSYIQ